MEETSVRAEALIQALPYIQQYRGRVMVVKYGGNAMLNNALKAAVVEDIILMACVGIRVVLVHGGGPEIETMLSALGKESRFIEGLRYTDRETMEVVQMVLCGKVNKDITALIENSGGRAAGLCGIDGSMLKARALKGGELGLVGEICAVDTSALTTLLDAGTIPVVSSVAIGTGDDSGKVFNVNADTAAAKIAAALGAEKLILMTDVRGILRDVHDEASLVASADRALLDEFRRGGIISKGMIPKVDCCLCALDAGVKKAHIIDGRRGHALLRELFTGEESGTTIT